MTFDWGLGPVLVASSALVALIGVAVLLFFARRQPGRAGAFGTDRSSDAVLVFDGDLLVDSTPDGRALIAGDQTRGGPWVRLLAALSPRFPEVEARLARLPADGSITMTSIVQGDDPPQVLCAEFRGGLTRIALQSRGGGGTDPATYRSMIEELEQLRDTLQRAPMMIWRERGDGETIWANGAYLKRAAELMPKGQDLTWPLPRLFEKMASTQGSTGQRQKLALPDGLRWFDLESHAAGEGRLVFAASADATMQAEAQLKEFMQTLTKTFAHLPIGLAIFDQKRQVHMFNPALVDLTGLSAEFLAMRPTLMAVLDALRERKMIPEPKDYKGWRRQLVELEKAASAGFYEETWSLPGGQTYRVTGRPHPNGALALMMEDITSEMARTRRYRANLELGQSVIDQMGEAIAVFSQAGHLVMSNTTYASLWGHDPGASLAEAGLRSMSAYWRSLSAPSALWSDIEDFAAMVGDRTGWSGEARLLDGRLIACRFAPLAAGSTLVAFRVLTPEDGVARLTEAKGPHLVAGRA